MNGAWVLVYTRAYSIFSFTYVKCTEIDDPSHLHNQHFDPSESCQSMDLGGVLIIVGIS